MTESITNYTNASMIRDKISAAQAYQHITGNQPKFKGSEGRAPCPICGSNDNLSINKNSKFQCFTPGCISGCGSIDMVLSLDAASGVNEACRFLGNVFGLAEINQKDLANQKVTCESANSSQENQTKQRKALTIVNGYLN